MSVGSGSARAAIILFNKTDLREAEAGFLEPSEEIEVKAVSALTGSG